MIAVLAVCVPSFAQTTTAEAYFNQASKEYVKQDKMQALRTLDQALQQYPGDPRLLKLAEELVKEEQQKQQEQQKQEQQQQEQEKKEQEKQDQQQAQDQKEQEKKDQEQAQEQKQQEQEKQGQEQQQNAQQGEKGEPRAGTIAPQDAMRMLDALERSEKDVQEKVRVKLRPATRRSIQKDW